MRPLLLPTQQRQRDMSTGRMLARKSSNIGMHLTSMQRLSIPQNHGYCTRTPQAVLELYALVSATNAIHISFCDRLCPNNELNRRFGYRVSLCRSEIKEFTRPIIYSIWIEFVSSSVSRLMNCTTCQVSNARLHQDDSDYVFWASCTRRGNTKGN